MFAFYLHDEKSSLDFENKIIWFKKRYNLVSYNDVLNVLYNGEKIKNACHLTIDDGWYSTYDVIFPILKKHNIPVTIFVSPYVTRTGKNFWYKELEELNTDLLMTFMINDKGFDKRIANFPVELVLKELPVDLIYSILTEFKDKFKINNYARGFINELELKEMNDSGLVEIGAHTLIHPVLANENDERCTYEISESIKELKLMLEKDITAFAYPNGLKGLDFSQREESIVEKCGIKAAFSVNPGYITAKSNPYALPRIGSFSRLKLGKIGSVLPSLSNQFSIRNKIHSILK